MKHVFTFLCLLPIWVGLSASVFGQDRLVGIQKVVGQKDLVYTYAKATASPTAKAARAATDCPLTLNTDPPAVSGQLACAGGILPNRPISGVGTSGSGCNLTLGPIAIELSDATGMFTSPTLLATASTAQDAFYRVISNAVSLPANLPAGSNYKIRFRVTTTGVISNESLSFTINVAPSVSITPSSTTFCQGQSAQILASGANSYTWSTQQTTNPISVSTTGTYSVTGVITNGCSATASATVTVTPLPDDPMVSNAIYCQGQSTQPISATANPGASLRYYTSNVATNFSTTAPTPPTATTGVTTFYVSQLSSGCESARAPLTVTVNPLPTAYSVTGTGSYCQGGSGVAVGLAGSQTGVNYQLLLNGNAVGSPVAGTGNALAFGNQTTGGTYTVRTTNASASCQQTMSGSALVTVNPLPMVYAVIGGGTYCAGSNGISVGLAGSQTGVNYQLQRDGTAVGSPVAGTGNALSFGNQSQAGTYTILAINASTACPQTMSGTASVSITPLPDAPRVVTASGYPYPAGQSNLTISQNVGPVSLTVLGCSGGMIMATGSAANSFTISTALTGTQTYTVTCTSNGCTSPAGSFQLTVVPTALSVLHRDADYGQLTNNIIKPYLKLTNAGLQTIPYGEITVRYWFTAESNALPTNLAVYYAQLGAVNMNYVALSQPRQGANGYVEYSFPGGGSLGGGSNSGPIENGIQKTDGSNFDESDDYSYQANYQDYASNRHITAYRNGVIFYGQEPTRVALQTAVQVYSQAKDGSTTSQIQTRVEVRNTGNVALPVANLKLRYYFTSDNNQTANVYVDYADMGADNVQARVVRLPAPVSGADSYVELSFPGNTMQVNALSSLGAIDFRLVRSDYGLFDQNNDYSYAANYGNGGLNNRITAYLNNALIFGTPPSGAPARVSTLEAGTGLLVTVLGNPVVGDQAQLLITGVAGQAVSLRLVDLQGRAIHEQRIEQAAETESVSLPLGQSQGQLLLGVSAGSQQQSLTLLRP